MVGFIVTGHGEFAPGLASAVRMVAGDQPLFRVVPFREAEAGAYADVLGQALAELAAESDGVIAFVDLLGGTPFNQTMMAAAETPGIEVVTGANLPMLVECLVARTADTAADTLVKTALAVGGAGITHKNLADLMAPPPEDGEGGR